MLVWCVCVRGGESGLGSGRTRARAPASVVEGATEIARRCASLVPSRLVGSVSVSGERW